MMKLILDRRFEFAVVLLALFLRLYGIHSQGWYPDEGAFTELALTFWRELSPSIGPLKQTAFLPLGCSWLAPALAAPWAGLAPSAIEGVRLWTALLAAGTCLGLLELGRRLQRPLLGSAAALILAAWPLAVRLGSWSVYHHLGALLILLSALAAAAFQESPSRRAWLLLCTAVGFSIAAAYWTFWLALLPLGLAWPRERRPWLPLGLLFLALPTALFVGLGYAVDPPSFLIDLKALGALSRAELPLWLQRIAPLFSFWMVIKAFPPFALALLGLVGLAVKEFKAKALSPLGCAALALLLGALDVFRQRQNLEGFAYPLLLVLPAAAVGLGWLAEATWQAWQLRQARWVLGVAALAGVFVKAPQLRMMDQLCAPPVPAQELLAKAKAELQPGDLVVGQTALNWGFPRGVKACQFEDLAVAEGEAVSLMPAGLPPSRFKYQSRLKDVRWIVISPYSHGFTFAQAACRRFCLQAEMLGFHQIWSNSEYTLYANRLLDGYRSPYAPRILGYYNLYESAAQEAYARKELPAARFALQQAMPYVDGDRAARQRALEQVEREMGLRK